MDDHSTQFFSKCMKDDCGKNIVETDMAKSFLLHSNIHGWRVLLICMVLFESDGFLSTLIGIDQVLASWGYSGFMLLFAVFSLIKVVLVNRGVVLRSFFYPIALVSLFFVVSMVSGSLIFPKPVSDWLPSLFVFFPIFIFYFLYFINAKIDEIAVSFVIVGVVVSLMLLVDRIYPLYFLDSYQRSSSFSDLGMRRIVLLKNELIFGFVVVVSALISGKFNNYTRSMLVSVAAVLFFVQAMIMESRMGFSAMIIACFVLLVMRGISKRVVLTFVVMSFVVIFIFPFVFGEKIEKLAQMSIHDSVSNISIRIETILYMLDIYWDSYGWGVGMMSPTGTTNNVLYDGIHYNIADAGAWSALTQFGFAGLAAWLYLTVKSVKEFSRKYKYSARTDYAVSAATAFLLGFTISVLPLSFFTQAWCISIGGVLLYFLWSCQVFNNLTSNNNRLGSWPVNEGACN